MMVSVVTGTYNRLPHLQRMVGSVRRSVLKHFQYEIVVVDGGSTDSSQDWCKAQHDIVLEEQNELLGAVKAFNAGAHAACGDYVIMANDDIEFVDESILEAFVFMQENPTVGVGCFYQDRGGNAWHVENQPAVFGGKQITHPYGQVCIVPRWLGNRVGWWGDYLHTYGGDNELSSRVLELGYRVVPIPCACIHDMRVEDELRRINSDIYNDPAAAARAGKPLKDTVIWSQRWTRGNLVGPVIVQQPTIPSQSVIHKRILYLPIYEPGNVEQKKQKRGLRIALADAGMAVCEYDYMQMCCAKGKMYGVDYVFDIANTFLPDMILFQIQGTGEFSADILQELRQEHPGTLFVNWNGDYHPNDLFSDAYKAMMKTMDLVGVVTTTVAPVYAAEGIKWFYWQIGYEEPTEPVPNVSVSNDIVFLANEYSPSRTVLAKHLTDLGVNVKFYGDWKSVPSDGKTLYDFNAGVVAYRSSKLAVGDSQWPGATGFVSNRIFQALAADGAMLLHQWFDGIDHLLGLEDGKHLVVWNDLDDLADKVRYWLHSSRSEERVHIAHAGAAYVARHHSFDARVDELLERTGWQRPAL